jgi:hypothetical protein
VDLNTPIPINTSDISADETAPFPLSTLYCNGFGSVKSGTSQELHGKIPSEKPPYRRGNFPLVWNSCAVATSQSNVVPLLFRDVNPAEGLLGSLSRTRAASSTLQDDAHWAVRGSARSNICSLLRLWFRFRALSPFPACHMEKVISTTSKFSRIRADPSGQMFVQLIIESSMEDPVRIVVMPNTPCVFIAESSQAHTSRKPTQHPELPLC